jgi:hypothetical protein
MKKFVKFVFKTILWLLVIVLAAVLTLPLWIGPVAKTVANKAVPDVTGTGFNLGKFCLNFYNGKLCVGDVTLYNPEGFSPSEAFKLGELKVDVDVLSAFTDTVVIEEIVIRDVFASYVSKDGINNFEVIMENVQKATAGEADEEKPELQAPRPSQGAEGNLPESVEVPEPAGKESPSKKVIIDRFVLSGVKVQWGPVPISLPTDIVLTGIGRESNGVDWETAANDIIDAVMKKLNALGQGIIDLGNSLKDIGLDGAGAVMDAVKDIDVQGAADAVMDAVNDIDVSGAVDSLSDAAGSVLESVGDVDVSGAAESVSEAAGSAVESAGKILGNITGSVGSAAGSTAEGAGSAVGSIADGAGSALGATTDAVTGGATKAVEATSDMLKGAGGAIKGIFGK